MMRSDNVALVTLPALHDKNLLRSNYRTARSGRCHSRNQEYKSVHGRPAAAAFVFLTGAAGTRGVPANLGTAPARFRSVSTETDLPMRPEIAVRPQQPSRHVHDDFFALLWADRLSAHLRVFVVLVVEHEHRNHASAALLVVDKLSPAVMAHAHAPHEPASPVVAVRQAVFVLQQERHVDLILVQRPGDSVPVPHHQSQNFIGLVEAGELAGVRHLAAEDLRVVLARHDNLRACDQGGEKSPEVCSRAKTTRRLILEGTSKKEGGTDEI